jgi:hypothetical protein
MVIGVRTVLEQMSGWLPWRRRAAGTLVADDDAFYQLGSYVSVLVIAAVLAPEQATDDAVRIRNAMSDLITTFVPAYYNVAAYAPVHAEVARCILALIDTAQENQPVDTWDAARHLISILGEHVEVTPADRKRYRAGFVDHIQYAATEAQRQEEEA